MRRRPITALVLSVAAATAISLSGCTSGGPQVTPTPGATATPIGPTVLSPLQPRPDNPLTKPVAKSETERLIDEIESYLDQDQVLNEQRVGDFTAGEDSEGYYAVILTISLTPDTNPVVVAEALATRLLDGGWSSFDAQNDNGYYTAAMSSTSEDGGWFGQIDGDATVKGQSVVTIKIASPDIY
jgi:hypothetical protein